MNIAFAGFRHSHIFGLYNTAKETDGVFITGCFEEDEDARKTAEKSGIEFNYNSYSEVLNDAKVDAIAIGDYYGKRGRMIIDALKAGKHVICDKPICTNLAELDEIEQLTHEKNLKLSCMLDLRYMPQTAKVTELVKSGEIGDIATVSFTGQHCLDYGNRPGWYFEDGKHGGTINDIAIHGIDLIRLVTGKNLTRVNCAKVWNKFADKEPAFRDCGQFMVEMEDISVMGDVSYSAPKFGGILPTFWNFYIWGTKGMIHFCYGEDVIHLYKETEEIIQCNRNGLKWLDDFISEVNGGGFRNGTRETINSQRQVLEIQKEADKC